ncbi:OLC1v1000957C1 [Oldenlandia corymbosa var. corymbosa]|uniref:WAT1-related protein n=1 Tax=Oldenlandia corymbosa var. corymbosa TaxID=529605 RepID=A0AAV1D7P7_OLDCO|nr:OLC1v1000957C1 [Oldenlandia corymbosa var. corymbosa]
MNKNGCGPGGKNGDGGAWKPAVMMIAGQVMLSGMNILLKLAANDGMDSRVIVAYRFVFGAVFMAPISFFSERKSRPKLTWKVFFYACLAGLFGGSLGQNLYLQSLVLTSATFVSAMLNLVPAVTFLVALCFRLEKLGWKTAAGKAKMLGTILGIGGAMVFTFYKGPDVTIWDTKLNLLELTSSHHSATKPAAAGGDHKLVIGIILGLLSCVSYSLWLIIQARASADYPAPLSFTGLMNFTSAVSSALYAVCMQRDPSEWKLGWNIRLLAVAYSGFVCSAVLFTIVAVVVRMKGPTFAAVFNPCVLVVTGLVSSLVLEEDLFLGNLLGGLIIIISLYMVLWGKKKEAEKSNKLVPIENATPPDLEMQEKEEVDKKNRSTTNV